MLTIKEYDEQGDLFIVTDAQGQEFTVDAGTLANLLSTHDEPHTFIGLTFTVQVNA